MGDTVVMTALVRDLALAYPGQFDIFVHTNLPDIWRNNPYCRDVIALRASADRVVKLDYGKTLHRQKYETVHFLAAFHRDVQLQMGLTVPTLRPYGDIHLTQTETDTAVAGLPPRYWVVVAGYKDDYPAKAWPTAYWQETVDALAGLGIACVQVGKLENQNLRHHHAPLRGVVDHRGRTDVRQLAAVISRADGVICGITGAMHIAAALQRPCVVVAGGREAWYWEAYVRENAGLPLADTLTVPHRYLHSGGTLLCAKHHGCWKNRFVLAPGKEHDDVCYNASKATGSLASKCLADIKPELVVESVLTYYLDGTLDQGPIMDHVDLALPAAASPSRFRTAAGRHGTITVRLDGPEPAVPPARVNPPAESKLDKQLSSFQDDDVFDHPVIGGKLTVCMLLYGDYPAMHRESLTALTATLPPGRVDLRLASNALGEQSKQIVSDVIASGVVAKYYGSPENRKKYPVMREMFHDPDMPLSTNYVVWLDDDTICDIDPHWLRKFAATIVSGHPEGARLFGPKYAYTLQPGQDQWIRRASWYRGLPYHAAGERPTTGNRIYFATGSLWALATHVIREQEIPCVRLGHNGGDWSVGVQVQQGGWSMRAFDSKAKQIVRWSAYPRRGLSERHPGT
jgi:ADP-heptose:LPS heptosyltransferase